MLQGNFNNVLREILFASGSNELPYLILSSFLSFSGFVRDRRTCAPNESFSCPVVVA